MKLSEIIDFTPKSSKMSVADYRNRIIGGTNLSKIGKGEFGTAYDIESPKRQNEITKIGQAGRLNNFMAVDSPANDDGYMVWLKTAYKLSEKGNKNPYFPVIHNLIIRQDPSKKEYYRVDLEKLTSFTSEKIISNYDLMMSLYSNMFLLKNPDDIKDLRSCKPEYIADAIKNKLELAITHDDVSEIKDKNLSNIIGIISLLLDRHHFILDLHVGNLMWRVTNNRPHLVILDPFA
jgi:hypothetical protein